MRKFLLLLIVLLGKALGAQVAPFNLQISDATQQAVPGVAVVVLDNSGKPIESGLTDLNGQLQLSLPLQTLQLQCQLLGYRDTSLSISPVNGQWPALRLSMNTASELLREVAVDAAAEMQTIKGDTTIMNANAFTVSEDASTGDLLKKMPGIEVNNGTVQAQGEAVTKVFVDGKPFFGEDSKAALDLIPAEMVEGVKIYDRQSDQSRFTGFRDGQTDKTLDIITKKEKRFGVFGQVNAGVGTEEAYQLNTQLNLFRNKERISFILTSDNVNGTGNGLGQFVRRRGRNIPVSNIPNGIATSWNTGLNYSNTFSNGIELQASYSFNSIDRAERSRVRRAYILPSDSGQIFTEQSQTRTLQLNHVVNLDMNWQIDSNHAIEFSPTFNFNRSDISSQTFSQTLQNVQLLNSNIRRASSLEDSWQLTGELLYKYRFPKKKRTFSSSLQYANSHANGIENLEALSAFDRNGQLVNDTISQTGQSRSSAPVLSGELIFTEPIGASGLAELRYTLERDRQDSELRTWDLQASDANLVLDSTLSNVFLSDIYTHEYSLGYQWQPDSSAWSLSTRLGGQQVLIDNQQSLPSSFDQLRRYQAILPYAALFYEPKKSSLRIRLRYEAETDVPSISQLQEVVVNRNPLQLTTGNPNLRLSYTHDVSMRLIANDPRNGNGFFTFMSVSTTQDFIGSSTQIASLSQPVAGLEAGQQLTRPENIDGRLSARAFAFYGFPMIKGKLKGNVRAGSSYEETPSLINLERNIARTLSPSVSLGLSSNLSEVIDFNVSGGLQFGQITNSLNSAADNDFRNWNAQFGAKYRPKWGLILETDLTYIANVGLSQGFDVNYTVWNAGIGYRFLKSKRLEAKLWMFDILGQNTAISRSFTATYTEDREELVLSQYLMFSLTYRLSDFKPGQGGRPPGGSGRGPGRGGPPR